MYFWNFKNIEYESEYTFLFILLYGGWAVQLQAQVTVTGKVIDEQQQPVPYANIVLLSFARFYFRGRKYQ